MTTLSREAIRALAIAEVVRGHLDVLLSVLVAAGERDLARRLARRCGSTLFAELGDPTALSDLRARGIRLVLAGDARRIRAQVRVELKRHGVAADSPEAFADAVTRLAHEPDGGER